MKRAALLILLMGSSLSCSLFRSRPAPYPEGIVFPLAETARVEFEGRAVKSLVRSGDKLFLSTDKGAVHCLDDHGRKILWTYASPAAMGCPPAVGPAVLAVWDAANTVHGVSPEGAPAWKTQLQGTASSDIAFSEDRLFVGTREGVLYCLSQSTGEVLWRFETGGAIEAACAVWRESAVLASTDGWIYVLGPDGKPRYKWQAGAAIRVTPLVEGDSLYFGADDAGFNCLDLRSRRLIWRLGAGAKTLSTPRADGQRVYFTASNTVLYALKKSGGDIVWWKILPSRSPYSPEIAGDTVLAASASMVLVGLERRTGLEKGRHDAGLEIRSNPCWSAPDILVALYDPASDKGCLSRLQKLLKVELSASLPQPAAVGAEVVFTASAVGFHLPKYEFYVRKDTEITVTQEASTKSAWTWFPESEGKVTIGVRVSDAKDKQETELEFDVANPKK
jgi:outer membrane protein assembly factor BamB